MSRRVLPSEARTRVMGGHHGSRPTRPTRRATEPVMPESSIVVRPAPITSGSYTASSRLQAAGLRPAIQLFETVAASVPLPTGSRPIVIADYGASTGHNSLLPICAAIKVLRQRTRAEKSVLVTHTDLPDN